MVGPALAIAYALNSVKFDPATAGRCNDSGECSLAGGQGNWNIEALGHDTFDFGDDMNHAHVQPTGNTITMECRNYLWNFWEMIGE